MIDRPTTMEWTEERALQSCQAGDHSKNQAFEFLYQEHAPEILRYAKRIVVDSNLADDVVQESFVRLYQNFDKFKSGHPLRPYLLKITHHVALKALAQKKKTQNLPQLDSLVDPQINPEQRELQSIVLQALQSLAPEYRSILTLRHRNGLKLRELASVLDCTERTTRNRLHTAAVLFERELERHGLGKDA